MSRSFQPVDRTRKDGQLDHVRAEYIQVIEFFLFGKVEIGE